MDSMLLTVNQQQQHQQQEQREVMRLDSNTSQESYASSSYFLQDRPSTAATTTKLTQKFLRRYIYYTILVITIVAFLIFSFFSHQRERRDVDILDQRLTRLEGVNKLKKDDPKYGGTIEKKDSFVSINLCGDGHEIRSVRGKSYTNWKKTISSGDIDYDEVNGRIIIKVPGIYCVYAQMYLYENQDIKEDTLEFHIKRNSYIEALSAVPKSACKDYCTRAISSVTELKKGDVIYLTSYVIGVQFWMSCDKSHFGIYLLKKT